MIKTLFTRKTFIAISLSVMYAVLLVFTCACIDGAHTFYPKKNLVNMLAVGMRFEEIAGGTSGFVMVMLLAVFVTIAAVAICFERQFAVFKNIQPESGKMFLWYTGTAVVCIALSLTLGTLMQSPLTSENIGKAMKYLGQIVLLTTVIYIVLFAVIGAPVMLAVNFFLVDKPFRFFSSASQPEFDDDNVSLDVTGSFDGQSTVRQQGISDGTAAAAAPSYDGSSAGGNAVGKLTGDDTIIRDREEVFPSLTAIDEKYEGFELPAAKGDDVSLKELAEKFRLYLAKTQELYFDIDTVRFFISGFAASHFEILEGLSGTGKSSLPRYFAEFIGANVLFMPVQATWRDKTSIIGFYNEFSKTYTETEFLSTLYEANYSPDTLNFYVLDEMNISRVEYYFADLLSVLEYPVADWKLKIMSVPHDFVPPVKLENGFVRIPENSYFVGTANRDDSTFTITDKVYDRAITLEFLKKNDAFTVSENVEKIHVTASALRGLYAAAEADSANAFNAQDKARLDKISGFVYDTFDVAVGNRILNQLEKIVPAFIACGGTKEDALDFMLCKKLFSKLEGRFEDYVKPALEETLALMDETYGKGTLSRSEKVIRKIIKTL